MSSAEMRLEQIEVAVEIVIAHADAHSGLFLAVFAERHAAHHTLFAKSSVVVVHEKQAGSGIAGHVDIGPAIFVEIRGNHRHSVASSQRRNPGLHAHVRESAVAIVAIERMHTREAARAARTPPAHLSTCNCCSARAWARASRSNCT